MILIILILALVILLLVLLGSKRSAQSTRFDPPLQHRSDATNDSIIYGESPDGSWHGGGLPENFTPGGGDFGGAGSSGSWGGESSSDSGDGGSD